MRPRITRTLGLLLLLSLVPRIFAQTVTQNGTLFTSSAITGITISQFNVKSPTVPLCGNAPLGYVKPPSLGMNLVDPLYGTPEYFSLPAGNGAQTFDVSFIAQFADPNRPFTGVSVLVDGAFCASCTAQLQPPYYTVGTNPVPYTYRITHFAGNAWSNNGVREFTLRFTRLGSPDQVLDILFRAVMVGTAYTEVLGHYDAPSLPLFILRDPPGGESFSSFTSGSTTCFGQSHSVNAGQEENVWYKAKLGVAGEAGLFVTTEFELYVEAGVNVTASRSETSTYEYQTCLEATSEFTTADNGTPDDLFIGSAIRYAYGMAQTVERPSCGVVEKYANFASTPVEVLTSYHYNEGYILSTIIPDLEEDIAAMPPGTPAHAKAVDQLNVWYQAIQLNATIKANAPLDVTRSFNGGSSGFTHTQQTTTTQSQAIEYTAILENGLSAEFGVEAGGTGISAGGSIKMRTEYGNGEENSNASTNTMAYHLEDGDVFDDFTVEVRRDEYFGTYVFVLDSAESRTSCRYEGGYALDQPGISVGSPGNTTMTVNEAPVGSAVNYPLFICNNSDTTRTYYLRFASVSNSQGATLRAFGSLLNSNDNGIELPLMGGQCTTTNLELTQPNDAVVDFPNINVYLYSLCDEEYPPYIRSYVSVSAYFGAGNFGDVCEPASEQGTSYGDFIDGVQLGTINNTGTGARNGPSYTNYSAQFSTPLSRGAQRLITITSGDYSENTYAAWIDYDHDGVFSAVEKLGAFQSSATYQPNNIPFTVPVNAVLGSTLLRVRSGFVGEVGPAEMDACLNYDYGETEDYAVVIDANTPQDCQGVNNGSALPGTACSDGNPATGNDVWNANCVCIGVPVDCVGAPGGSNVPGTACDDGNPNTASDVYNTNCQCLGQLIDCTGVVGGGALPGTACNDGIASTGNDTWNTNCQCMGLPIDCAGVIGGNALPGTACNDGNPLSTNDVYDSNCQCAGTLSLDCNGVPGGPAQPGTPCNDNNPATGGDTFGANCVCAGLPFDCAGTPGGGLLPGTPCNDGNPLTINDAFNSNCACVGQLVNDCAGVPGGAAQPGTPCNDGNPNTGNDTWNVNCQCVGLPLDCTGVPGGFILPGAPCDDGDETTGSDLWNSSCQCSGLPIDCEGVAGGLTLPGSGCDDGDPNTTNDIYNLNCVCAGTLALDCEGVAGGAAQPGTACDDGDPGTGNDVYSANCICAGLPLDCEGTPGGAVLPGTACNDGDPCTTNDVFGADCACSGTPLSVGIITAPLAADAGSTATIFIAPLAGATNYQWTMPADWTSTNTSTFVLVAQTGSILGEREVCIDVTANGCALTGCTNVTVTGSTDVSEPAASAWFSVQPNPSNGLFHLRPVGLTLGDIDLQVYDASGRAVWSALTSFNGNPLAINLDGMENGTYYLIAQRNGERRVMPLVLTR